MRVLKFDGSKESQDCFASLYEGWLVSTQGLRGIESLKTAVRIQDELEKVSEEILPAGLGSNGPSPPPQEGVRLRRLKADGGTMALEESEWQMFRGALQVVDWRVFAARRGLAALQLVEGAEQKAPAAA